MIRKPRWIRHDQHKRPLTVTGKPASSTNPQTWAMHGEAVKSTIGIGLGYVLGEGIGCIDIDHCLTDGRPNRQTQQIVDKYPNNYIEISPSGDGLHIWGLLEEQPGRRETIDGQSVETYSVGRYITVTGNIYQPGKLQPL